MLNVTRQEARRLFYALIAILVFLFILIVWLFSRTAAPALEPVGGLLWMQTWVDLYLVV